MLFMLLFTICACVNMCVCMWGPQDRGQWVLTAPELLGDSRFVLARIGCGGRDVVAFLGMLSCWRAFGLWALHVASVLFVA